MIVNINKKTGVHFGFIPANSLDSEIVDFLIWENFNTINHTFNDWKNTITKQNESEWVDGEENAINPDDFCADDYADEYQGYEDYITGEYQGIKYGTSWLGGALHFFIFESPYTGLFDMCSPCVPNAGNLNHPNNLGVVAYSVPDDWKKKE